jgi:hypothetical protein
VEGMLKRRYTAGRGLWTTKLLARMMGQAQRSRYVVIVFLYCRFPLSCTLAPRSSTLRHSLLSLPYTRFTILLCIPLLPCWHDFTVTIVIHTITNATRRHVTALFSSAFPFSHNNTPKSSQEHATGWQSLQTHAEHQPRHIQTFSTLHHHVIFREPTANPESCAAIRLRWQP